MLTNMSSSFVRLAFTLLIGGPWVAWTVVGDVVTVDFLSREGSLGTFTDVSAGFRAFPCAEDVWGHLCKLGWKMRCETADPSLKVVATMSHRGKAFVVANGGARDASFVPSVSGDMGAALHLYRFDSGRAPFKPVGVWRAGARVEVPSGALLLATTLILDAGGETRTGSALRVNGNRFAGAPDDVIRWANPFIGTAWNGHTFPGATWPFGLVQSSPDTGFGDWQHCSGYTYLDPWIYGFSQTHLSGTGCEDLGDVLLQPFTGEAAVTADDIRGAKDFASELAYPGYYTVAATNFGVKTELTAAPHVAWHRYTFPNGKRARLLVDLQFGNVRDVHVFSHVQEASDAFSADSRMIEGHSVRSSWLRGRHVAFRIEFSRPFAAKRTLPPKQGEKAGRYVLDFDLPSGEPLVAKVAISSTDEKGAARNMSAEAADWDFDAAVRRCGDAWRALFGRVELLEGTPDEKETFYTALYHVFSQPNDLADADGRSRDAGGKIFQTRRGRHYTGLSLWDTFRAAHPFYTLVAPERVDDFCDSMLAQYRAIGYLPVIPYFGRESFCMIGNHSVPVIVDAWLKGFRGFDGEEAFAAITNSLTVFHKTPKGRKKAKENWDLLDRYGYYPFDVIKGESVSRTLECSYDDWCAAEMARALGHAEAEAFFRKRAANWRNVFDPSTGFMRGKDTKGRWREPFDPFACGHGGDVANDYTEGNAWQYTWHVLQDTSGLIAALGGGDRFSERLDGLFRAPEAAESESFMQDVTGVIGQYCQGNEPSHHVPYLYTLAGHPEKAAERIREITTRLYSPTLGGLCGNDDCGQLSVWYVFAGMGFYPVNPCGGEFVLGAPQLKKIRLSVGGGRTFAVMAKGLSARNKYVRRILLNGKEHVKPVIHYADIMRGGELTFEMEDRPACASGRALEAGIDVNGCLRVGGKGARMALVVHREGWHGVSTGVRADGSVPDPDGGTVSFGLFDERGPTGHGTATLRQGADGRVAYDVSATSDCDQRPEAVALSLTLPCEAYAGGEWTDASGKAFRFPVVADKAHFGEGRATSMRFVSADGREAFTLDFPVPVRYVAQDDRKWRISTFTMRFLGDSPKSFKKGDRHAFSCSISSPGGVRAASDRPVVIARGDDWIPLACVKNVEKGSALDFSAMGLQDAPAGKYGWLRNVGGHFEFEGRPGVRQRFYGVNLCFDANFPDRALADELVTRLTRCGYNALRVHHYESDRGVIKGSEDRLGVNEEWTKRLDYLLFRAMENGIYVTTDLFTIRPVRWRDVGIDRKGDVPMQVYKNLICVHAPAFENWKAFARNMLGHVNPYTGRRYADEPGLPLISLINEGTLLWCWNEIRHEAPMKATWKKWLAGKRAADPGFAKGMSEDAARVPWRGNSTLAAFMADMEADFAKRARDFLRSLGVKALLTNQNCGPHTAAMNSVLETWYDYVDDHFYVNHPQYVGQRGRLPSRLSDESAVSLARKRLASTSESRLPSKPFCITEWNFCAPGAARGIGGLMTGATAGGQDWDGLWRFSYAHAVDNLRDGLARPSFFDIGYDPVGQVSDRACVCLFLRGDMPPGPVPPGGADDGFLVDTPRTAGGFAKAGRLAAGPLAFDVGGVPAALWVSSLDGRPIVRSDHVLLAHVTDVQGDGAAYSDASRTMLLKWGAYPPIMRNGSAMVVVAIADPGSCEVWSLDMSGRRQERVPAAALDGKLSFTVSVKGAKGARVYYEIVRYRKE